MGLVRVLGPAFTYDRLLHVGKEKDARTVYLIFFLSFFLFSLFQTKVGPSKLF